MNAQDTFSKTIEKLARDGLERSLTTQSGTGGKFTVNGRTILNFSSNDYLDLATDSRLKQAACSAIKKSGCSATASRLMSGHLELHDELEKKLAQLVNRTASLAFGSGFLANIGVITAIASRGDFIFADRLNHASLIDGARLSGARLFRYHHNDMDHLEDLLKNKQHQSAGKTVIVSDSVFSMDGDMADIERLSGLSDKFDAILVIDEAHAIGVFGPRGGGLCSVLSCNRPDIIIGTLSKALGGYGGFAAGSARMKKFLINRARSFIYSTGLPPACLGSAIRALEILKDSLESGQKQDNNLNSKNDGKHGNLLGDELLARAAYFRDLLSEYGLKTGSSSCQIIPIMVGENHKALELADSLKNFNILATAIRPPTVPKKTARIRLSVTLAHTREDLKYTAKKLAETAQKLKLLK